MTFYDKMRIVCMAIPKGKVATYGQIAMLCGKPKNSRQVGYGLRENLAGTDVPAFRIVNGRGELSGAFHFPVPDLQKALLQDEGVEVFQSRNTWCLDLKKYGWMTTPEDVTIFTDTFASNDEESTHLNSNCGFSTTII